MYGGWDTRIENTEYWVTSSKVALIYSDGNHIFVWGGERGHEEDFRFEISDFKGMAKDGARFRDSRVSPESRPSGLAYVVSYNQATAPPQEVGNDADLSIFEISVAALLVNLVDRLFQNELHILTECQPRQHFFILRNQIEILR